MLVEKKIVELGAPFTTEGGAVLTAPQVAYESYGQADGPVILLCHGGLSSCHAAGKYAQSDAQAGWWDGLIGPGKAFDTDHFRVVSMNALGSMHGSTGPNTIDPASGGRYGPTFPAITLRDQVHFVAAFLDALKIEKVFCMSGPSMGSLHTLQFAALYPQRIERAVAVATAARMPASGMAMHHFIVNALRMDPGFQGGWYEQGRPLGAMKLLWQVIKLYYTSDKIYKQMCFDSIPHGPNAQKQRAEKARWFLLSGMDAGIQQYDPNALISSVEAINTHDLAEGATSLETGVRRIQCPCLLINVNTDHEFPPHEAQSIADILNAARPGQATVRIVDSPWGHLGCVREHTQIGQYVTEWLSAT